MMHRHVRRATDLAKAHYRQFLRYLLSGGMAFVLDFGTFKLLMYVFDVWYVGASFAGSVVGFFAAFTFHKYIVFQKHKQTTSQFIRYCLLQLFNAIAQTVLVYVFVEYLGVPPELGKVMSIACSVLWNFVLYKLFVYV